MALEVTHISEEEYRRWMTPPQALAALPHPFNGKSNAAAIMNRVALGRIRSAAELVTYKGGGEESEAEFVTLTRAFWKIATSPAWPDHDFWRTGDIMIFLPAAGQGYSIGRGHEMEWTGVRFDPDGVEKLRLQLSDDPPQLSPPEAPKNDDRKPPSPAELKRFCRAVLTEWPDATEDWLREKATLFFPDNRIRRDPFRVILREIRGHKNPGRPRKTVN